MQKRQPGSLNGNRHRAIPHATTLWRWLAGALLAVAGLLAAQSGVSAEPEHLPPFIPPLPADAPAPPANPRDLHGMWLNYSRTPEQILTAEGELPPLTPAAAEARDAKARAAAAGRPMVNSAVMCRPPGFLWVLGLYFPVRVMQQDRGVTFVFERFHTVWRIGLGAQPVRNPPPTYTGYSTGHWEGNTLVVETTAFRVAQWLDDLGTLVSDKARLTSRLTKSPSGRELEVVTTIDDPQTYTRPWMTRQVLHWRPDYVVLTEHDCEESAGQPGDAEKYGYGGGRGVP